MKLKMTYEITYRVILARLLRVAYPVRINITILDEKFRELAHLRDAIDAQAMNKIECLPYFYSTM